VESARAKELIEKHRDWPSLVLTKRQICDLELLMNGGFSPLTTFMNRADYESVVSNMRLADGTIWPMPIVLDVPDDIAESLGSGGPLALLEEEGMLVAVIHVTEFFRPLPNEAAQVYGTEDEKHPGVAYLKYNTNPTFVSGKLEGVALPNHYDFADLRHTPRSLRDEFRKRGWTSVVAFQTRNPMHRAHVELTTRAASEAQANLLIQPTVGMTRPGDIDHFTRVRVYKALMGKFPSTTTMLSLLPLAMRMGGPREALWHAMIRKNYGATHFIVGRHHASPGKDSKGEEFYEPYEAQELVEKYADEIGIGVVPGRTVVFVPSKDMYQRTDEIAPGTEFTNISGTELRARLRDGRPLPDWFTYPEVADELRRSHPPRNKQGFCVFFTGLSGSGKSTIANALALKLLELGGRRVTLLDGDIVRQNLSSELGFSREHRDLNIHRIGFVASEVAKHGGIALCAPIAPYDETRKRVRFEIERSGGGFVLVYVNTPLEVCEKRDRKGLYKQARSGKIKEFTGISDPYEVPKDAELILDTVIYEPDELAQKILLYLEREGYITHS
jgi:sulfate adenylyltransferase